MALTLHKTSKHTRVYRGELPNGDNVGYSKTSIAPMHYETVPGSGDYDCPIDLKVERVQTAEIDGYQMVNAGYHFRLQTGPSKDKQLRTGTVGFGGRRGQHWFNFRLLNVGYIHWPTRDLTDLGGRPDYSAAPAFSERTRNLGTHKEVADELVVVNTMIRWHDIWTTPGGGEIYLQWGLKGGKMKEEIVVNQAARDWFATNPPATPADETWFGFRFEIDMADVPKLWRNGVEQDMADGDFDDDEGRGLHLTNALDELLAFMPLDEVYVGRKGGRRPLRKRFYKAKGKNYLMVAVKLSDLAGLLPGDLKFDPSMTQEQVASTADDCIQITNRGLGPVFVPENNNITKGYIAAGHYDYYYSPPFSGAYYTAGVRFTPDVPPLASFIGNGPQYATLRLYQDDYFSTAYQLPFSVNTFADVKGPNQPAFAANMIDSPAPGTNWRDSASFSETLVTVNPGAGVQWPDIDVSAQFTEAVEQPGWVANNGVRFAVRGPRTDSVPDGSTSQMMVSESYRGIASAAAVLDAFYIIKGSRRKPGFRDDNKTRNKRTSRLVRNDTDYRLNSNSPSNNRNRNRFINMPVDS